MRKWPLSKIDKGDGPAQLAFTFLNEIENQNNYFILALKIF